MWWDVWLLWQVKTLVQFVDIDFKSLFLSNAISYHNWIFSDNPGPIYFRSDESNCPTRPTPPNPYPTDVYLNIRVYPIEQEIEEGKNSIWLILTYNHFELSKKILSFHNFITIIISGQEVVFQCRDEGPLRVNVKWSRGNGAEGLPFPPGTRDFNGRLEIPDIKVSIYWLSSF